MEAKDFTATIEVPKSPQNVFDCITRDVAKWWGGPDFEGNSTALNDEFIIDHPGAHYSKQKLVELIPGRRIVWQVTESKLTWLKNQDDWTGTRMIFEISGRGDSTILRFAHEGLSPEKESYATCAEGWKLVITDYLFNFITSGKPHFLVE
jgi:uncharacterized protein YndB with AHSA1/START domain